MNFKLTLQNASRLALLFLTLVVIGAVLAVQFAGPMTVFQRNLGAGADFLPQWVVLCDGYNPFHYAPRRCTKLIDCVYSKMTQVQVADTAIGATIDGLLPTMLVLLAPPLDELIQQGLVAPHRAVALSCFSIGVPMGVFKHLTPFRERPGLAPASEVVEWELHFAVLSSTRWLHMLIKIIGDAIIMACTAVVIWKVWAINKAVMVPWKCETPVMAFSWTIGCMFWVVFALLLLHSMVAELRFEEPGNSSVTYRWWEVWSLPYTLRSRQGSQELQGIKVVWEMPQAPWYRTSLVYKCVMEVFAAASYFYGTVVWLSALFLGAVNALQYVSLTVGMFVVVRITSGTV